MGQPVATVRQSVGEEFQGEKTRRTRDYGAAKSGRCQSAQLCDSGQVAAGDDEIDGATGRSETNRNVPAAGGD